MDKTPDEVAKATFEWGSFFSTPTGKVIGGLIVALLMLASSWITDRTKPQPVVNIVPGNDPLPVSPIVEPGNSKVVLHLTADAKDVLEHLKGLTFQTDPKIYRDGSTYPFGGKSISLPCMTRWSNGRVVDVQSFTKAEEVAAFIKKAP